MAKGFETRRPLGPLAVGALLVVFTGGGWPAAAALGISPPSAPPSQAGDTDPVAGNAAGTPPLPPPAAPRPKKDLRNEQIQELYRQALGSWALAQEERACEQLMAVETAVVDDREVSTRKRLLRAEEAVIHTVAAQDLEVLIPIARLHFEAAKRYLAHSRGFALVLTHSRGMVHDLAVLYQEQTATPTAAQVASSILTTLGELMQTAAQHASAAELYEKAVALDPRNSVASLGLAMVYEKHENYKSAVSTLRRLLQANPDHPEGRLRLAINLRRIDRRDEARKLLEALLALRPSKTPRAARPSDPAAGSTAAIAATRPSDPAAAGTPAASATLAAAGTPAAAAPATADIGASAADAPGAPPAPAAAPALSAEQQAAQKAAEKAAVDALFSNSPAPDPGASAAARATAAGVAAGGSAPAGGAATGAAAPAPADAATLAAGAAAPPPTPSATLAAAPAAPAASAPAAPAAVTAEALDWVQRLAAEELAQLDDAAGNHAAAVKVLRTALDRHPGSATLRIELAEMLDHAGEIRASHAVLEKVLEQPPGADDNCRFRYNSPGGETFAVPRAVFAAGAHTRLPALAAALGVHAQGGAGTTGGGF
jgi:tetratricopeptide (TPR) repeat protein